MTRRTRQQRKIRDIRFQEVDPGEQGWTWDEQGFWRTREGIVHPGPAWMKLKRMMIVRP